MNLFDTINKRRSIRRFTEETVPEDVMNKALEMAVLAPNSSNTQTWDFYWVQSGDKKAKLVEACLSQAAARTAAELLVVVAAPKSWQRSQKRLIEWVKSSNAPKPVVMYYEKLIPAMYRWGIFNILGFVRFLIFNLVGLFRPIMRRPATRRDVQEIAIKSAALAAENFVLAMTAQGYATCMMEGFDECRVKRLLKLKCHDRVVMVIGVGKESDKGTWGPRYRLPLSEVVHKV